MTTETQKNLEDLSKFMRVNEISSMSFEELLSTEYTNLNAETSFERSFIDKINSVYFNGKVFLIFDKEDFEKQVEFGLPVLTDWMNDEDDETLKSEFDDIGINHTILSKNEMISILNRKKIINNKNEIMWLKLCHFNELQEFLSQNIEKSVITTNAVLKSKYLHQSGVNEIGVRCSERGFENVFSVNLDKYIDWKKIDKNKVKKVSPVNEALPLNLTGKILDSKVVRPLLDDISEKLKNTSNILTQTQSLIEFSLKTKSDSKLKKDLETSNKEFLIEDAKLKLVEYEFTSKGDLDLDFDLFLSEIRTINENLHDFMKMKSEYSGNEYKVNVLKSKRIINDLAISNKKMVERPITDSVGRDVLYEVFQNAFNSFNESMKSIGIKDIFKDSKADSLELLSKVVASSSTYYPFDMYERPHLEYKAFFPRSHRKVATLQQKITDVTKNFIMSLDEQSNSQDILVLLQGHSVLMGDSEGYDNDFHMDVYNLIMNDKLIKKLSADSSQKYEKLKKDLKKKIENCKILKEKIGKL